MWAGSASLSTAIKLNERVPCGPICHLLYAFITEPPLVATTGESNRRLNIVLFFFKCIYLIIRSSLKKLLSFLRIKKKLSICINDF